MVSVSDSVKSFEAISQALKAKTASVNKMSDPNAKEVSASLSTSYEGIGASLKVSNFKYYNDIFVKQNIQKSLSEVGQFEALNNFHQRIQQYFGDSESDLQPHKILNKIFTSLNSLSSSANNTANREQVVAQFKDMAEHFNGFAAEINRLRFQADKEISFTIDNANNLINQIKGLNDTISTLSDGNIEKANLSISRDQKVEELAKIIQIDVKESKSGSIDIALPGGINLINSYDGIVGKIEYQATNGVSAIAKNLDENSQFEKFNQILVRTFDSKGIEVNNAEVEIVSAGNDYHDIKNNNIKGGSLAGLLEFRDEDTVQQYEVVRNLALTMAEEFNKVHNLGSSFPPKTSMLGVESFTAEQLTDWQGVVSIGLTDRSGKSLTRSDGTVVSSLELDLGKLDDGNGAGRPSVKTIIDEINKYFADAPLEKSVELGDLRDVKLAAKSSFNTLSSVKFDFEFENSKSSTTTNQVTSVTILDKDNNDITATALKNLDYSKFTVEEFERLRAGELELDLTGLDGEITIKANTSTINDIGEQAAGVIDYKIDLDKARSNNDRFSAVTANGDATINNAENIVPLLRADLVDAAGKPVAAGEKGFLSLSTVDPNIGIILNDKSSVSNMATRYDQFDYEAANRGFGQYFGLNNLYRVSEDATAGFRLDVRDDILLNSENLATAQTAKTKSKEVSKAVGVNKASNIIRFDITGNQPAEDDTITINGANYIFKNVPASENHVAIGANWTETLENLQNKLTETSAINAGTADAANYTIVNNDSLAIEYNIAGEVGNSFAFNVNLSGGAQAEIDGGGLQAVLNGNLQGGLTENKVVKVSDGKYTIGENSANNIQNLLTIRNKNIAFKGAGSLSSFNVDFKTYMRNFLELSTNQHNVSKDSFTNKTAKYDSLKENERELGGIDPNKVMMETMQLVQNQKAVLNALKLNMDSVDRLLDIAGR